LAYWVGELESGRRTLQRITLDVLYGVQGQDTVTVLNKREAADYFSAKVAAGCPYGGEEFGVSVLGEVTADSTTVNEAVRRIDSHCI
jgi:hypothetical protein